MEHSKIEIITNSKEMETDHALIRPCRTLYTTKRAGDMIKMKSKVIEVGFLKNVRIFFYKFS